MYAPTRTSMLVKVQARLNAGEDFDANSSFGEYETVRVLGEGGFGRVSLAKHKATSELVAIKVMKAERIGSAH
jgi:serine/threonine protein kinase